MQLESASSVVAAAVVSLGVLRQMAGDPGLPGWIDGCSADDGADDWRCSLCVVANLGLLELEADS